jgi:hypothetical protein
MDVHPATWYSRHQRLRNPTQAGDLVKGLVDMNGKRKVGELTDEEAGHAKRMLVNGYTIRAVALAINRSEKTVERMKAGLTYKHVKVEGEEKLRPMLAQVEDILEGRAPPAQATVEVPEEVWRASLARVMAPERPALVAPTEEMAKTLRILTGRNDITVEGAEAVVPEAPANPYEGLSADEFRRRVENGEL